MAYIRTSPISRAETLTQCFLHVQPDQRFYGNAARERRITLVASRRPSHFRFAITIVPPHRFIPRQRASINTAEHPRPSMALASRATITSGHCAVSPARLVRRLASSAWGRSHIPADDGRRRTSYNWLLPPVTSLHPPKTGQVRALRLVGPSSSGQLLFIVRALVKYVRPGTDVYRTRPAQPVACCSKVGMQVTNRAD
jgi:hypothetical protein